MSKPKLSRISLTVPEDLLVALDQNIAEHGYQSRSQAVVDMIQGHLINQFITDNAVMVGTLSLLYDTQYVQVRLQVIELQKMYLRQVISSLQMQLSDHKVLEVMIIQGQSHTLRQICTEFSALKGVIRGQLALMNAVIPQVET